MNLLTRAIMRAVATLFTIIAVVGLMLLALGAIVLRAVFEGMK